MDFLCKIFSIPAELLSKVPAVGPIVKVCCTSVGQKLLMALTGLALCGFLVAHLAGNLLLYAGEEQFNEYAHKLHSLGPLLWAAEAGLLALFLGHIGLAISTAAMSKRARRNRYEEKTSKQDGLVISGGGAANWMLPTGLLIFVFVVLHIADMKFNVRGLDHGEENLFAHVKQVLSDPIAKLVYVVALLGLGLHLTHGVSSAFQTLGISHARWNKLIRIGAVVFAWAIALGFISLLFFSYGPSAANG